MPLLWGEAIFETRSLINGMVLYIYIYTILYIYVHTCDLILVANHSSEFSDNDNRVLAMVWVVVGNGVVVVSKQILEYGI